MLTKNLISFFKCDPNQPRKDFNEDELRSLGASMLTHGQIQPVLHRPDGTLIAGERRWQAAILVGMKELLGIQTDRVLSDTEIRLIQLAENIHRAELSGFERWSSCTEILCANASWDQKKLAEHLTLCASGECGCKTLRYCPDCCGWSKSPPARTVMAAPNRSVPASAEDRETRIRQLMDRLQPILEQRARKMAETLTDTPPDQILGKVEYTLRDQAHRLATEVHQVALDGDQKRGTTGPVESAPTAPTTPGSSSTGPAPS